MAKWSHKNEKLKSGALNDVQKQKGPGESQICRQTVPGLRLKGERKKLHITLGRYGANLDIGDVHWAKLTHVNTWQLSRPSQKQANTYKRNLSKQICLYGLISCGG